MLDIQFIRENTEVVKQAAANKNVVVDIDLFLQLDAQKTKFQQELDKIRAERNSLAAKNKGGKPSEEDIAKGKELKESLEPKEKAFLELEAEFTALYLSIPNIPLEHVPVGKSEDENVVIEEVGEKPEFEFQPKNHWEIAQLHDWIDKERAAKIASSRFAYIKGDLALLQFALVNYGISVLTNQSIIEKIISEQSLNISTKPFTLVLPPAVANTEAFQATARLNKEETTYKLEDEDLWLNASAEHTMANMYMNEVLELEELPIRMLGYSTSFRREAGTYGKDLEGIIRMHQFNKLEMEVFSDQESSLDEHRFLVAVQKYLMDQLNLPYRVLQKCTADIGGPNAAGVDIDVWLPGQGKYLETHTADIMTDFQTRRLNTKYKDSSGNRILAHTNDATAFAQRPMIGILENNQNEDGTVRVPEVLQPFMNKEVMS